MARILIIEDNPTNLDLMVYLLTAFGHTPISAVNGEDGMEIVRASQPDLMLVDIQLPGIDGYEVVRRVRTDPQARSIPIIAVTALAMVGDRERILDSGFDGYITKPIVPETFQEQIETFLSADLQSSHAGHTAPDSIPAEPPQSQPAAWRATILAVDNAPVNLSLIYSILEPFGYEVLSANNVITGIQMARQHRPALIVSDVQMPELDGYEFIGLVRNDPELQHTPIILVSSSVSYEIIPRKGLDAGANKVFLRPLEPLKILAAIEELLKE